MTLSGSALTLALALIAAQGPHAATKRKKASPPAAAVERRAAVPSARSERRAERRPERKPTPGRGESDATKPAPSDHTDNASVAASDGQAGQPAPTIVKPAKTKVYTFGAMDVEGKLKTPQLLYFLNRVKLELEMSAPDHRSFMKELEKTADDPNL